MKAVAVYPGLPEDIIRNMKSFATVRFCDSKEPNDVIMIRNTNQIESFCTCSQSVVSGDCIHKQFLAANRFVSNEVRFV